MGQRVEPVGISAVELARAAVAKVDRGAARPLTHRELRAWLLSAGLARLDECGLLKPTPAAVELAGALRPLEGGDPYPRTWVRRRS